MNFYLKQLNSLNSKTFFKFKQFYFVYNDSQPDKSIIIFIF